ncbi:MAG: shikimate dehydrogenase [Rhodobacteraceae bacterium]|nr:shikimate dehydrogenase [Paracoccaceae bacterium]
MSHRNFNLAGVIGNPVGHSRSPKIHNHWLHQHGLSGSYIAMEISAEDFPQVIKTLPKMGFRGVNVTIPFKELVLQHVDIVSDTAAIIGAANTVIYRKNGTSYADNTDSAGFINNIRDMAPDWHPDRGPALVIGAGGAARAVIQSLLWEGVATVFVTNRTRQRAEMLATDFGNRVKLINFSELTGILPTMMMVVNTTSMGMHGMPDLMIPFDRLNPRAVVSDIVYTPRETHFLRKAHKQGCEVVDGLGMLLHQAARSFDYWFDVKPEIDDAVYTIAMDT